MPKELATDTVHKKSTNMCHHASSVPIFQTMGFTLTSTVEGLHAVLPGHETDLQLGRRQGPRSVAAKCRARRCW